MYLFGRHNPTQKNHRKWLQSKDTRALSGMHGLKMWVQSFRSWERSKMSLQSGKRPSEEMKGMPHRSLNQTVGFLGHLRAPFSSLLHTPEAHLKEICGCGLFCLMGWTPQKIHRRCIKFLRELYQPHFLAYAERRRDSTQWIEPWATKLLQAGSRLRKPLRHEHVDLSW